MEHCTLDPPFHDVIIAVFAPVPRAVLLSTLHPFFDGNSTRDDEDEDEDDRHRSDGSYDHDDHYDDSNNNDE